VERPRAGGAGSARRRARRVRRRTRSNVGCTIAAVASAASRARAAMCILVFRFREEDAKTCGRPADVQAPAPGGVGREQRSAQRARAIPARAARVYPAGGGAQCGARARRARGRGCEALASILNEVIVHVQQDDLLERRLDSRPSSAAAGARARRSATDESRPAHTVRRCSTKGAYEILHELMLLMMAVCRRLTVCYD
jgi:hypothetical protein